jgi:hypothetical protein
MAPVRDPVVRWNPLRKVLVMRRIRSVLLALVLATIALAAPASADPSNAPESGSFDLVCGDDSFPVVVNGNGRWSPAHSADSNTIFVPTWFGEVHFVLTTADGTILEEGTDEPMAKGAGKHADIDCTFHDTGTFEDPELGVLTFTVDGEVSGFATPRH